MTIQECSLEDGTVVVRTFALLAHDYPCATQVRVGGKLLYKAWSRTQRVGDYDDAQIRAVVVQWCAERNINPRSLPWSR